MVTARIYITSADLVSPAGWGIQEHLDGLLSERCFLQYIDGFPQGRLSKFAAEALEKCREEKNLKYHDSLTRLAILLSRSMANKSRIPRDYGVILGSSRGPTQLLESLVTQHNLKKRLHFSASPTTTCSSLSAAVAQDLGLEGPSSFVSAACATGMHAVIHAAGTIRLGLAKGMIAGGIEFANTPFTLDMLGAAKVYANAVNSEYPCRPGSDDRSGMVLSEGGAVLLLDSDPWFPPLAELVGWGAAIEKSNLTGISVEGTALIQAIRQALDIAGLLPEDIDLIVGHGAGTLKGDAAELSAYKKIFCGRVPIVFHKWMFGHMLAASSCASLILGIHHLNQGMLPPHPYRNFGEPEKLERRLVQQRYLLVTALGFGGNATALIVKNPALDQI